MVRGFAADPIRPESQRMRACSKRAGPGVLGLAAAMVALCVPQATGFAFTAPAVVGAGGHRHAVCGQAKVGRGASAQRPMHIAMASSAAEDPAKRPVTKLRLVQHKAEAFWFYRCAGACVAAPTREDIPARCPCA